MSLESNGQITSASFTCDIGYTLDGLSLLNCSSAGLWSSMPPSCGSMYLNNIQLLLVNSQRLNMHLT